jgi:hypothetical protein
MRFAMGRPLILLLFDGQLSDHKSARLILAAVPTGSTLIADRGYDSNWFRAALSDRDITPCMPSTKSRRVPMASYDAAVHHASPHFRRAWW